MRLLYLLIPDRFSNIRIIPPSRLCSLCLLSVLFMHCRTAQSHLRDPVRDFPEIPVEARQVYFSNDLPVNNEGGHLQGIQLIRKKRKEYAVVSGSSSTYSYLAVAQLGEQGKVIDIRQLLEKPLKHAGGFQISDGLLAVGVEDNDSKDRSQVMVFSIDDPEQIPITPLAIIEREGAVKRATAGCIAIAHLKNELLLIAGDWDSKHLDFYTAAYSVDTIKSIAFEKTFTIDTEQMDKSDWIDSSWLSYQNINLIKGRNNGEIYLIGMASNAYDQDIADLYALHPLSPSGFRLQKLACKNFGRQENTKFRWGAGVSQTHRGRIRIVSCGENLWEEAVISVY